MSGSTDSPARINRKLHDNITEGHAGYDESGDSEIIAPERLAEKGQCTSGQRPK
jgi:hypothetical protein